MSRRFKLDPDMPVDAIMRACPATISVLIRHGMLCIGCPIGSFHTLAEACEAHGVDEDNFIEELNAAIEGDRLNAADCA